MPTPSSIPRRAAPALPPARAPLEKRSPVLRIVPGAPDPQLAYSYWMHNCGECHSPIPRHRSVCPDCESKE